MSESISSTVPAPAEEPQDWYFTFGYDHRHPITGKSLDRSYVRVHGTCDSTRLDVLAVFGRAWSSQYQTDAQVKKYNLTEVAMPQLVDPDPVRPMNDTVDDGGAVSE
jgi:hypothetical protein